MAELDKFVLEFEVSSGKAVRNLEALDKKVARVRTEGAKAGSSLKEFASGAADEIGRAVPIVGQMASMLRSVGTAAGAAGVGVAALGVLIGAALKTREQFNAQRLDAQSIGMSPVRLEDINRKMLAANPGRVTRDDVSDTLKRSQEALNSVAQDPSMTPQRRTLQMLGIDPGVGGKTISNKDFITALGKRWSTMPEDRVQAEARFAIPGGIKPDVAKAIAKTGASIGTMSMSRAEVDAYGKTANDVSELDKKIGEFDLALNKLSMTLGDKVLPALTKVLEVANSAVDAYNKANPNVDKNSIKGSKAAQVLGTPNDKILDALLGKTQQPNASAPQAPADGTSSAARDQTKAAADNLKAGAADANKASDKNQKSVDALVDSLDAQNRGAAQNANAMALAIQQFAASVSTFSNALTPDQALALWSGERGAAMLGLGNAAGPTAPNGERNTGGDAMPRRLPESAAPTMAQWEKLIQDVAKSNGVDPNLMRAQVWAESKGNPNAVSPQGALGLGQLMPKTAEKLGVKNPFDPEENLTGMARLIKENLARAGGDVVLATRMYHGGLDPRNFGPKNDQYLNRVFGPQARTSTRADGLSMDGLAKSQVENTISQQTGIPAAQIREGTALTKGDVAFIGHNIAASMQNKLVQLRSELMNPMLTMGERSARVFEMKQTGIDYQKLVRNLGPVIAESKEGGRSEYTKNVQAVPSQQTVNFYITESQDPKHTARAVEEAMNRLSQTTANNSATSFVR